MASLSDDENVLLEEPGTRRTRSGRKVAVSPIQSTRQTRRTSRKKSEMDDAVVEADEIDLNKFDEMRKEQRTDVDIITEIIIEETIPVDVPQFEDMITEQQIGDDQIPLIVQDEKSSSFPFETIQSDLTVLYDQSSTGIENIQQGTDSIDNLLANLAEDNANSLPSGGDDVDFVITPQDIVMATEENVNNINHDASLKEGNVEIEIPVDNDKSLEQPNESDEQITDDHAIAEDLPNGTQSDETKVEDELDAEMVSEDELPAAPQQPKVDDAEEVSDEELPGPKLAELPADTEVVSEDELPASNKTKRKVDEGYDPGSPTESSEAPEKKVKTDDEIENAVGGDDKEKKKRDKEKKEEKEKEKKLLPDLDRYWKAVNDDPADFTGWTYLLQYVDQENDIEAAREAYDAFLAHYPYCYGYWRKYADYEKRKGNKKKCEEVFERGLRAIPLSVDLWIHYLTHVKSAHTDEEDIIRAQYERALNACGLEFRSDKLWEAYIKWETDGKRIPNVVAIYDRLLLTPTQGYNGHFDSFQEIVTSNTPQTLLTIDEFKKLRAEVREASHDKEKPDDGTDPTVAPGEDEPDDHVRSEEEATSIKDKILSTRRKIHKATIAAVTARWTFEEGIKRPYFHVKPLERCQLKNWKDYLDFEIEQGDQKRILVLFERCLIACALYDEFWLKLIRYLESRQDPNLEANTRDAFERACTVHHPDKPSLHLMWSAFEECLSNFPKAADILSNIEKVCPHLLQVSYRRINLERRRGDFDKCAQLYDHYISTAKNKNISGTLSIKYARFIHKIKGDLDGAVVILKAALEKDPANTRVALQMIDLALQRLTVDEKEIVEIMDSFMARDGMDVDQKVLFAQRKVEFLEDFGSTAKGLQDAQRALQIALAKANESKKKSEQTVTKKSSKDTQNHATALTGYGSSYNSYGSNSAGYYGAGQYGSQSYSDTYGYNQWQQYGSGYGSYNQWSSYGSSYY